MSETEIAKPTTLEEKIGQLINVRIGSNLPPVRTVDDDAERIARLLDRCPIGGLTLFNGLWPSTRDVLNQLQRACQIPLLVGSDIERGCGQQMAGMSVLPHAGAWGVVAKKDGGNAINLALEFGKATAAEARLAGIHVAFAPVADTNTNPRNPIIATRSFGTTPQHVAAMVKGYVRGCESGGVGAVAKHFPGHGDTEQDSHDSLPSVSRDRSSIASTELPPFEAAIEAECSMVMTAHVAYLALDPSGTPATLSKPILRDLLRKELGFTGVICSDSLLMSGVRDRFENEGELCLATLTAGVDWLLDVEHPEKVVDYLATCVADGRLEESQIDESVERILCLKHCFCQEPLVVERTEELTQGTDALSRKVAFDAVTSFSEGVTFKLDPNRPVTCLLAKPFTTHLDAAEQPMAAVLRDRFCEVEYFELTPDTKPHLLAAARRSAEESQQLILAMIVKPAAWHKFDLLDYQSQLFDELAVRPHTVIVSLGVSSILDQFPKSAQRICSYSDVPVSQQAVVEYLTRHSTGAP